MTEISVRAFLVGVLAAWVLGVVWRRVRWWIADRALKKFLEKQPDRGTLRDVHYPWAPTAGDAWRGAETFQSPAVVVEETDPWSENAPRSPAEP